jgi:nucleoside-diphosphate-sugar epimerase
MRIFVTGATGFVGSAVVQELIGAGHQVVGLSRSDANAASLTAAGAEVHRGDLENAESLKSGAADSDGVIHCGFIHDFSKFAENCELDRRVVEALGSALVGTDRPLIVTSGTALVAGNGLATEGASAGGLHPRVASEQAADAVAALGVRAAVMRLSPSTHGEGDHGFVPMLIDDARKKGVAAYVGEGQNVWPAVHRLDAAKLYRLAIESDFKAGTRFHAVAEEGVPFREIAEVIGKNLNVPVVAKTPEEAAEHFGWFSHFAAIDNPSSSKQTRETLGWEPTRSGLIADVDEYYFKD